MMVENTTQNDVEMVENQANLAEVAPEATIEKVKQDNLIKMRLKLEAAEEAARISEQRALEAERRAQYQEKGEVKDFDPNDLPEDPFDVEDDDYVQAKQVKKSTKAVNAKLRATEDRLAQMEQALYTLRAEKATDKIEDFNEVVSNDNLKILERLYPDEYETLMYNPNLKSKSITAYNMLTRYGIVDAKTSIKKEDNIRAVDKRIEDNKLKPGASSMAKSSSSPLTQTSRYDSDGRLVMTDADRDRINLRMKEKLGIV